MEIDRGWKPPAPMLVPVAPPAGVVGLDQRRRALVDSVTYLQTLGWKVEHFADMRAVVSRNAKPVDSQFHLVMTCMTMGAWIPVWVIVSKSRKRERLIVTVDPWGHSHWDAPPGQRP